MKLSILCLFLAFLLPHSAAFAWQTPADTIQPPAPCVMMIPDKMDVFYVGVDNPLSVSVPGFSSAEIKVSVSGCGPTITSDGVHHYNVRFNIPGETQITVNTSDGYSTTFRYRVKRLPDPIPLLGAKHRSTNIKAAEFKAQKGIATVLENFDFEVKCNMVGFEIVRIMPNGTKTTCDNPGGKYSAEAETFIQKASAGDTFLFNNIKGRCPGDTAARNLGSLVFMVE